MIQNLLLRLASTTRPLASLLEQYGATETQEQALYRLLDRVRDGVKGSERDRMSFAMFKRGFSEIFPARRDDREFLQLLIDTLKVERPAISRAARVHDGASLAGVGLVSSLSRHELTEDKRTSR